MRIDMSQSFIDDVLKTLKHKKYEELRELIQLPQAPEIAELLESLNIKDSMQLFRCINPKVSSNIFSHLSLSKQIIILDYLNEKEKKNLISFLSPDDRVSIVEKLPPDIRDSLFNLMNKETYDITNTLLNYPKGSVGRIMTTNFVSIKSTWTVEESMKYLREKAEISDSIDIVYVVDDKGELIDDIPLRLLILSNNSFYIKDIMDNYFTSVTSFDRIEKAIELIKKQDINLIPVVDPSGVLVGILTVDDLLDIDEQEATEDFFKIGAIEVTKENKNALTINIKEASLGILYKSRVSWLSSLVLVGIVSGISVAIFEKTIAQTLALIFFLPLTIDSGGNAGSQSATLMVRALATGEVKLSDWANLLFKELIVSLALGATLGIVVSVIGLLKGGLIIALIIGLAMVLIVVVGSTVGMCLPFILTKLGADPATSSGPLITSIADIFGILIYFSVATLILGL
jgi:magnesium transporter